MQDSLLARRDAVSHATRTRDCYKKQNAITTPRQKQKRSNCRCLLYRWQDRIHAPGVTIVTRIYLTVANTLEAIKGTPTFQTKLNSCG